MPCPRCKQANKLMLDTDALFCVNCGCVAERIEGVWLKTKRAEEVTA